MYLISRMIRSLLSFYEVSGIVTGARIMFYCRRSVILTILPYSKLPEMRLLQSDPLNLMGGWLNVIDARIKV